MWYNHFDFGTIIDAIVQALFFLIGLVIAIKVVLLEWKNRESKTWQLQIVGSVCSTVYFAFDLPFSTILATMPDFSEHTIDWFCNLATFIIIYGIFTITMNSLVIASMKYTFIVHPFKALEWGYEKIQKVFLALYLAAPFLMAIVVILTKDFESYKYLRICFGLRKEDLEKDTWKRLFLCNLKEIGIADSDNIHLQNSIQSICIIRSVLVFMITSNVLEAFFYYKIFTKMKRLVHMYHIHIILLAILLLLFRCDGFP